MPFLVCSTPLIFPGFSRMLAVCIFEEPKQKNLEDGAAYFTYRIVESFRIGKQVKQRTLLNIGADCCNHSAHFFDLHHGSVFSPPS